MTQFLLPYKIVVPILAQLSNAPEPNLSVVSHPVTVSASGSFSFFPPPFSPSQMHQ